MASSRLPSLFDLTQEDAQLLLAAQSHIGSKAVDTKMSNYVYKRRQDGVLRDLLSIVDLVLTQ